MVTKSHSKVRPGDRCSHAGHGPNCRVEYNYIRPCKWCESSIRMYGCLQANLALERLELEREGFHLCEERRRWKKVESQIINPTEIVEALAEVTDQLSQNEKDSLIKVLGTYGFKYEEPIGQPSRQTRDTTLEKFPDVWEIFECDVRLPSGSIQHRVLQIVPAGFTVLENEYISVDEDDELARLLSESTPGQQFEYKMPPYGTTNYLVLSRMEG